MYFRVLVVHAFALVFLVYAAVAQDPESDSDGCHKGQHIDGKHNHPCPSGHPKYHRRTLEREGLCPKGLTACSVLGRKAEAWECIDTQNDLESCGGCPPISLDPSTGSGEDCTTLLGVSDVSCIQGKCAVHLCMPGYDVHSSGYSCVISGNSSSGFLVAQSG